MPSRNTEKIAFTISRIGDSGGRPTGDGGGSRGPISLRIRHVTGESKPVTLTLRPAGCGPHQNVKPNAVSTIRWNHIPP
jgi:hypothetical protein